MLSEMINEGYANTIDIAEVLSKDSDASGAYRDVYFINDDIVLKIDTDEDDTANDYEWDNYKSSIAFDNTLVVYGGVKFRVRFPEMAMVGKYIFAERIHHPHIFECWDNDCFYGTDPCGNEECRIARAVYWWSKNHLGLIDISSNNFCWDADNETAWIIDLGA